jgi:integrase
MAKKLTEVSVYKAKPDPTKRVEIVDAGTGLYLVIQPSGAKSWAVRYRVNGMLKKLTLGGYPALSLKTARTEALKARGKVALAVDPAAERRAARQAEIEARKDSFAEVARAFVNKHAKAKTPRSWRQTAGRLGFNPDDLTINRGAVARWAKRPIGEIKKRDVIELLEAIKESGAPVMASNVFAVLRKLFNWAVARDIIAASPIAGVETPHKVESRERVLNDEEIKRLWHASGELAYPFGHIAKLLLLTGQRRDEVAGMRWSEINLEGRTWTIPKERAKNNKTHDVALSDAALAVIEEVRATPRVYSPNGFLFTFTGETPVSGFSKAKNALDERMGDAPTWRLHDLRRTAATGLQKLNIRLEVTEAVLGHISGSRAGIVGIYQRHDYADEKRRALETWGAFVLDLVQERSADNVVTISGRN